MQPNNCPGCLKPRREGYCNSCLKSLFGGAKVSPILTFSRPDFNRTKNDPTSRISLSGAQIKHSLKLTGRKLELTDQGGEYILKPIPYENFRDVSELPANEHFTMQLARQVFKIKVADNALVFFSDGEPAYLTKRFDRREDGARFLQEDFAQLSQKTEDTHGGGYKYDGSYEGIADLMKEFVGPYAVEVEKFFDLVVFNYLILNGDAHLKNFSLFRDPGKGIYTLTPAYDLLNTRFHLPDESGDTSLDLFNGDFATKSYEVNAYYAKDDFTALGGKIGMQPMRVAKVLEKFITRSQHIEAMLQKSYLSENSQARYLSLVRDRLKRLNYTLTA